jgi:hypothetical protein
MRLNSLMCGMFLSSAVVLAAPLGVSAQVDKPVSPSEIAELRRQLDRQTRSGAELFFGAHGESGDVNNRLDFFRYGGRFNLRRRSGSTVTLTGTRTHYATPSSLLEEQGTRLAVGYRPPASEDKQHQVEVGVTRFSTDNTTVDGLVSLTLRPIPTAGVSVTANRSNVEESVLSVAGVRPVAGPFAGELVGAVMENRAGVSGDLRLPYQFDLFAEGAVGVRSGPNVESNFFKRGLAGVGYNALATAEGRKVSLLRISASVFYMGFNEDRFGFGGGSLLHASGVPVPVEALGSDEISPDPEEVGRGIGGYFSPERFVSVLGRVDARGRLAPWVEYQAYVFAGRQSYTGSTPRLAAGVSGRVVFRLAERLSAPVILTWEDYGPFTQQQVLVTLAVGL